MAINVALVEDNEKVREGLRLLIDGSEGFHCPVAYGSAEEALRQIPAATPNVVLMDINLPRMSGIDCVAEIKARWPEVQVMMLTVFEDNEKIFQSLIAGATGYILKSTPPARLLAAIRDLHDGGSPMSDQIARRVVERFQELGKSRKPVDPLTDREMEILTLLARGYQDKEIADQLFLSIKTVRTHLRSIYQKLHVRSRTEAVLRYLRE